jgi:N-formylmaleamate deformylase
MLSAGQFVTIDGLRLHVRRLRGDSPTLVMIHGLSDNGACWGRLAAALTPKFEIVAIDLRGHGLSDAPDVGYAPSDHARDVIAAIDALGLGSTTIVGHSLGAEAAMQAARLRPDLVTRLVLEDPPFSFAPTEGNPKDNRQVHADWVRDLEYLKSLSFEQLHALGRGQMPGWIDADLEPWARSKLEVSPKALDCLIAARPAWQLLVRAIPCPTLLITGETDLGGLVSEAMAEQACSLCAELQVLHIPRAGHSVRRDQFESYLDGLQRFLV